MVTCAAAPAAIAAPETGTLSPPAARHSVPWNHELQLIPPTLPPTGAEGGDVLGRTLRPVLEVVATEARRLLVHWAQHVETPK
jgi:hypothetical protein